MVDIARAIRVGRAKKNISQHELARRIGISPPAVSLWESGQKTPSGDTLIKVALELDIIEDLFPGYKKTNKGTKNGKNALGA